MVLGNRELQIFDLSLLFLTLPLFDSVAQLVEHLPFKQRVTGSSPVRITFLRLRADSCLVLAY